MPTIGHFSGFFFIISRFYSFSCSSHAISLSPVYPSYKNLPCRFFLIFPYHFIVLFLAFSLQAVSLPLFLYFRSLSLVIFIFPISLPFSYPFFAICSSSPLHYIAVSSPIPYNLYAIPPPLHCLFPFAVSSPSPYNHFAIYPPSLCHFASMGHFFNISPPPSAHSAFPLWLFFLRLCPFI